MTREEVRDLVDLLCDVTVEAVNSYVDCSGEDTDQMPEYVMTAGAARLLAERGTSALLEVSREKLKRRIGSFIDQQVANSIETILQNFGRGKMDMVITAPEGNAVNRRPIGYVEFKKWKHKTRDDGRVSELSRLPGAEFGCLVVLRNSTAEKTAKELCELAQTFIVIAKPTTGHTMTGQNCCVVCIARTASGIINF